MNLPHSLIKSYIDSLVEREKKMIKFRFMVNNLCVKSLLLFEKKKAV